MKTAGIIGGMGPQATIDFLNKVVSLTKAGKDQEHIKLIIYMNPTIPDRSRALLENGENPESALITSARLLEKAGADFLAVPCVTAHYWIAKIRNSIKIPVLDIIEITLKKIKESSAVKKVGILATTGTLRTHLFEKRFEPEGYRIIVPDAKTQEQTVMRIIYAIKKGEQPGIFKAKLLQVCETLISDGAEVIIAACTEIPLIMHSNDLPIPFVDVNHLLAKAVVEAAEE